MQQSTLAYPPFYPCNTKGNLRLTLPTLVACPMSRAFHADKAGAIYNTIPTANGVIGPSEPTPDERELALGYSKGSTAAPLVTAAQRHTLTGNCMDQRCLSHLLNHCLNTSALQNIGHFFQSLRELSPYTHRMKTLGGGHLAFPPTSHPTTPSFLLVNLCTPRLHSGGEPTLPTHLPCHTQMQPMPKMSLDCFRTPDHQ